MVTDRIEANLEYFHYHLKCRHITDNAGDIELGREKSRQTTSSAYFYLKLHHWNGNGLDLKLTWNIFITTRIVGILVTMRVLLSLVERNHVRPLDMPISI